LQKQDTNPGHHFGSGVKVDFMSKVQWQRHDGNPGHHFGASAISGCDAFASGRSHASAIADGGITDRRRGSSDAAQCITESLMHRLRLVLPPAATEKCWENSLPATLASASADASAAPAGANQRRDARLRIADAMGSALMQKSRNGKRSLPVASPRCLCISQVMPRFGQRIFEAFSLMQTLPPYRGCPAATCHFGSDRCPGRKKHRILHHRATGWAFCIWALMHITARTVHHRAAGVHQRSLPVASASLTGTSDRCWLSPAATCWHQRILASAIAAAGISAVMHDIWAARAHASQPSQPGLRSELGQRSLPGFFLHHGSLPCISEYFGQGIVALAIADVANFGPAARRRASAIAAVHQRVESKQVYSHCIQSVKCPSAPASPRNAGASVQRPPAFKSQTHLLSSLLFVEVLCMQIPSVHHA
jgi:hypothetical protein